MKDLKKASLCDLHDYTIDILNELLLSACPDDMHTMVSLSRAINTLVVAKEKGQSMEDKLIEYRERIQELGFTRVRGETHRE